MPAQGAVDVVQVVAEHRDRRWPPGCRPVPASADRAAEPGRRPPRAGSRPDTAAGTARTPRPPSGQPPDLAACQPAGCAGSGRAATHAAGQDQDQHQDRRPPRLTTSSQRGQPRTGGPGPPAERRNAVELEQRRRPGWPPSPTTRSSPATQRHRGLGQPPSGKCSRSRATAASTQNAPCSRTATSQASESAESGREARTCHPISRAAVRATVRLTTTSRNPTGFRGRPPCDDDADHRRERDDDELEGQAGPACAGVGATARATDAARTPPVRIAAAVASSRARIMGSA